MMPPRLRAPLLTLAALLLASCESRPDRHAMMEEARHSVPPMAADEPFFNGTVIAHLTLRGDAGSGGQGDDTETAGGGSRGGSRGGGGGGRRGGGSRGGMRQSGSDTSGTSDSGASPSMHRSAMPAAFLRLRLENTTAAAIEIEVRDLDSALGDFAVRPDKLTVMPGQSDEPDPMESLLGLDSYDLPVTVTLRISGKTETKVLTLHLVNPPSVTPPPVIPPPATTSPATN